MQGVIPNTKTGGYSKFRDSLVNQNNQVVQSANRGSAMAPISSTKFKLSLLKESPKGLEQASFRRSVMPAFGKKFSMMNIQPRADIIQDKMEKIAEEAEENKAVNKRSIMSIEKLRERSKSHYRNSVISSTVKAILEEKKEVKRVKNLEEKKEKDELEELKIQMGGLRKTLENTKDTKALAMISKKVLRINGRISVIMKRQKIRDDLENKLQPTEEDLNEDKESDSDSDSKSEKTTSEEPEPEFHPELIFTRANYRRSKSLKVSDLKRFKESLNMSSRKKLKTSKSLAKIMNSQKFNIKDFDVKNLDLDKKIHKNENKHKVAQILLEYQLMQHRDRIANKKTTNVGYKNSLPNFHFIRPAAEKSLYTPATNINKESTLHKKSYRPDGFRNEFKKNVDLKKIKPNVMPIINAKRNTIDDLLNDYEIDKEKKKNRLSLRGNSPTFLTLQMGRENSKKEKDKNNYLQHPMRENLLNRFKSIFTQMLHDSKTIKNNIYDIFINKKRVYKEEDFKNLLDLFNKDPKNKNTTSGNVNSTNNKDKAKDKDAHSMLRKLRPSVRQIFNEAYKKMDFEDRILNRVNADNIMKDEKKAANLKLKREMKKIAWETMFMMGITIDDGKDTEIKEIFKAEYSNIDYLEWQVKKRHLLGK
jgi:hypothetical protein